MLPWTRVYKCTCVFISLEWVTEGAIAGHVETPGWTCLRLLTAVRHFTKSPAVSGAPLSLQPDQHVLPSFCCCSHSGGCEGVFRGGFDMSIFSRADWVRLHLWMQSTAPPMWRQATRKRGFPDRFVPACQPWHWHVFEKYRHLFTRQDQFSAFKVTIYLRAFCKCPVT